ncbi:N-acetylmuramoyl-L-alanine amidase [Alkalihalophilus lindianensis]|uniref:N-acetylmuramoyl-L-alanine amidase n=1 Tax=Alkalihalophilus lindianensis TaxID=1630542 RepID=A0ABU3X927_9BACI|nr:N-acetylmuramoyl-L-alanine amidase [Alkalihalophilus lindianensis]MDV2684328.1 N-acetylmuramoyl-L-alanine amidase [Alkalihalophilus lindianensis]
MLKKVTWVLFAFLLVFPLLGVEGKGFAQTTQFNDVSTSHWANKEIHFLRGKNVISGYEDNTFKPNNSLTRAQAAVIMTNILGVGERNVSQATFPDVPTTFWASGSIEQAAALGIFTGRDGRFYPNEHISKAQMAVVLSRSFNLAGQSTSSFTDISNGFWAVQEISSLERNHIVETGGKFEPNRATTRAEFAAYVTRSAEPSFRLSSSDGDTVQFEGRVVTSSSTLNIRSQPSTSGTVIGSLTRGATVDIYGQSGNWYQIKHGSGWGYVHSDFIEKVSGSGSDGGTSNPEVIAEAQVTASSLNVRESANTTSNTIGRLTQGQTVSIYGYEGNWALILFNGKWAYVHADYLNISTPGSNGLTNRVIAIDPGHGGTDPGAVANGLRETDITLGIGRELEKLLNNRGANPFLTRTNDTFIPLEERAKMANDRNADLFVSIHANAFSSSSANGVESYWNSTHSSADSKKLAESINKYLASDLGMNNRGVKEAGFVVIRQSRMPAVLIEVGFITNTNDANKMKQPDFYNKAANAVLKGIEDYYNN